MKDGRAAVGFRAMRELHEGASPDFARLAQAYGCTEGYLRRVAEKEGWGEAAIASEADPEGLEKRLLVLSDRLVADLEAASAEGHAAGSYDKARIDALSAMLRMIEKIGEMTRVPERAAEMQKRSDEELAAALALVDARIVELACELAAAMGGGEADTGDVLPGAG